jgi:hypothetical protein
MQGKFGDASSILRKGIKKKEGNTDIIRICMYICMYVYMYVCMYICIYV